LQAVATSLARQDRVFMSSIVSLVTSGNAVLGIASIFLIAPFCRPLIEGEVYTPPRGMLSAQERNRSASRDYFQLVRERQY